MLQQPLVLYLPRILQLLMHPFNPALQLGLVVPILLPVFPQHPVHLHDFLPKEDEDLLGTELLLLIIFIRISCCKWRTLFPFLLTFIFQILCCLPLLIWVSLRLGS